VAARTRKKETASRDPTIAIHQLRVAAGGGRKFRFIVEIPPGDGQRHGREEEREREKGRSSATTILLWNGAGSYFSGTSAARAARRQAGIIR